MAVAFLHKEDTEASLVNLAAVHNKPQARLEAAEALQASHLEAEVHLVREVVVVLMSVVSVPRAVAAPCELVQGGRQKPFRVSYSVKSTNSRGKKKHTPAAAGGGT